MNNLQAKIDGAFSIINAAAKEKPSYILRVERLTHKFGWSIETTDGWVDINSVDDLCRFAQSLQ